MTIEAQVQQVLTNQATILTNQATILAAIQALPGSTSDAAALAQIEQQVTDIQAQLETPAPAPTPAPTPPPEPTPAPDSAPSAA